MTTIKSVWPIRARAILVGTVLCIACAGAGKFIWVDEYPVGEASAVAYIIQRGDTLTIHVLNQDSVSGRTKVREDGKISLLYLNDVVAAGYAPVALAQQLQTRLKDYINIPVVTVSVEERAPLQVPVMGEVAKAGIYQLENGSGLLQAFAASGGLTDFAHHDRIFVLRAHPEQARIRFSWDALTHAEGRAVGFRLQAGDVIVVE